MVNYKNAVFGGGGAKSLAYLGAIQALEANHVIEEIENACGSSGGGIFAAFMALGLSSAQMKDALLRINLDIRDTESDPTVLTENFFERQGLYTGYQSNENLRKEIGATVSQFGFGPDLNFAQLHLLHRLQPTHYKDLYLNGTNITLNGKSEVFCYENTPDMRISDALKITASFPLVWIPVDYKGGRYIDGGIVDNIPYSVFDSEKFNNSGQEHNPETLVLSVTDSRKGGASDYAKMVLSVFDGMEPEKLDYYISNTNELTGNRYYQDFIEYLTQIQEFWSGDFIPESMSDQRLIIDVMGNTNTLDFGIGEEKVGLLQQLGYQQAVDFLNAHGIDL